MKFITQLKNFIPNLWYNNLHTPPKVLLGRWTIDYCEKKINKKIDLSNEDHCGACNNSKTINSKTININTIDIKELIFFETI
jgi:hypothetical protein